MASFSLVVSSAFLLISCTEVTPFVRVEKPIATESKKEGDTSVFIGQNVGTWEVLTPDNTVRLGGITLPSTLVQSAILFDSSTSTVSLDMPGETKRSTFIEHLDLQFNVNGFMEDLPQPSFAVRFYGIDQSVQSAIDCSDSTEADTDKIPEGYVDDNRGCEGGVGTRMVVAEPPDDLDHPIPFARVNVLQYAGRMIGIEALITADKLLAKKSFTLYLPAPKILEANALYPTTLTGVYRKDIDSYDISIWGFTDLTATEE